jgi:hypothetical protein
VSKALQPLKSSSRQSGQRRSSYWLISKRRRGRVDIWTTGLADGRSVLPVFSFEEEAALFLSLGVQGNWQVRRVGPGELVSLLYGPCRGVELVALDPVSDVEAAVVNRCVSLTRKRFVNVLLRNGTPVRPFSDAL